MNRLRLAVVALLAAAAPIHAQERPAAVDPGIAAILELAKPGEAHARLEKLVGTFDVAVKAYPAPNAPPQESRARVEKKLVLGGRYLEETFSGTLMGMPFEGRGFLGYDNLKQRYVHTWFDNLSTEAVSSEGACDGAGKTFTLEGTRENPRSDVKRRFRAVTRIVDEKTHVFEMHEILPDGTEFKTFELVHVRAAAK